MLNKFCTLWDLADRIKKLQPGEVLIVVVGDDSCAEKCKLFECAAGRVTHAEIISVNVDTVPDQLSIQRM